MRLRRLTTAIAATAVASSLVLVPASAMTTNTPSDNGDHPGVVALLVTRVKDGVQEATMYCSGMLLTSRVVLTASHCDDIVNDPWFTTGELRPFGLAVTNVQRLPDLTDGYWFPYNELKSKSTVALGNVRLNPDYRKGYRDDVSAQVLDEAMPVAEGSYGVLPEQGLLDQMQAAGSLRKTTALVLGYGSSQKVVPANVDVTFPDTNERRIGKMPLVALTPLWLKESQSIAKGQDGACYGDSGGPTIIPDATTGALVVVGVTSTGDGPCFATNVASRTDTASARTFINGVIASVPRED